MRSRTRILVVIGAALLLLASVAASAYLWQHRMMGVQSYERGSPTLPQRVLIATQGSAFKDGLVAAVVARLESRPAHVKVIDVAGLGGVDADDWQAIVIVHTWEFGKPPPVVSDFVSRLSGSDKIIDVTTSGSGREKLPGVDVISSASVMDEVPEVAAQVGSRVDALLLRP